MKDYPSQFGNSPLYRNPDGTLPMPAPQNIPEPQWYSGNIAWNWVQNGSIDGTDEAEPEPTGFIYEYTWFSPTFDLKPQLRSGQGGPKTGVPIWNPSCRLFLQISSAAVAGQISALSFPNLSATGVDYVATTFNFDTQSAAATEKGPPSTGAASLRGVSDIDVTSKIAPPAGAASSLAGFSPPGTSLGFGEGHPIRYWRLELSLRIIVEHQLPLPATATAPPAVTMQAAMY